MQQQRATQQRNGGQPGGSQAYPGVSTRGLEDIGYGEQAQQLESETQQQNQYLDEISKGLDQLKFGAQVRAHVWACKAGGVVHLRGCSANAGSVHMVVYYLHA